MADTRLQSAGNIRLRWHSSTAFANYKYPQVSELNAGLNLVDSVSWNDFSFGVTGSNSLDDPSIGDKAQVQTRGATQYGGSLSFYYPEDLTDTDNVHQLVFTALKTKGVIGYISVSIDGEVGETTPTYSGGAVTDYASGDYVHIFRVRGGGWSHSTVGEDAFRYTINFLPQGESAVYTVAGSTAAVVAITADSTTPAQNDIVVCTATVNGRPYTRGLKWSTSDASLATVSQNGIVTVVGSTGSVDITATFVATGASDTESLTIT